MNTFTKNPHYKKVTFKNKLNGESVIHYFNGDTLEIDGEVFWATYDERKGLTLLAKDAWIPQRHR